MTFCEMPRVGSSPKPLPLAHEGQLKGALQEADVGAAGLLPEMCRRRQGARMLCQSSLALAHWAPEL